MGIVICRDTGTNINDQVGKREQAELEMQPGVDKHEVGFGH